MSYSSSEIISDYKNHLNHFGRFEQETWEHLEPILKVQLINKGHYTLKPGKVCRFIDYIYKGSFRAFRLKEEEEVTTAISVEQSFITDMKSLSSLTPSNIYLQALEDSVVVRLRKEALISLYDQSNELQRVGRCILEAMVVAENDWKAMYTLYDPQERYQFLLQRNPEFIQRIPLQYIASFLGMRRETLSRIRSRKS